MSPQNLDCETGSLWWKKCGQVICLKCASGKFICVLFLHTLQAGRQGGKQQTKAADHGCSSNDRLQLQIQTKKKKNCHLHRCSFFFYFAPSGGNSEKWCHASLGPQIYTLKSTFWFVSYLYQESCCRVSSRAGTKSWAIKQLPKS